MSLQNSKMCVHYRDSSSSSILTLCNAFSILTNFFGCARSAPDGSSPRGYIRVVALGCRLNLFVNELHMFSLSCVLSGTRIILPIRVAPEPMIRCLHLENRLQNSCRALYIAFVNSKIFLSLIEMKMVCNQLV
jgi:hypothetical protein